jgi:protein translocase SecG subunit
MILDIIQLVLAVLLTAAILLQARGTGVGLAFGGDGNVYRTRRGVEKKLHTLTIILAILFFGVALVNTLYTF